MYIFFLSIRSRPLLLFAVLPLRIRRIHSRKEILRGESHFVVKEESNFTHSNRLLQIFLHVFEHFTVYNVSLTKCNVRDVLVSIEYWSYILLRKR